MPAIVFARLKNGKAAAALVPIAALAALHRLEGKRMLRDVLRTRSLVHDDGGNTPFIVRSHDSNTRTERTRATSPVAGGGEAPNR